MLPFICISSFTSLVENLLKIRKVVTVCIIFFLNLTLSVLNVVASSAYSEKVITSMLDM